MELTLIQVALFPNYFLIDNFFLSNYGIFKMYKNITRQWYIRTFFKNYFQIAPLT